MPKIGILYGMENTFPSALVERINQRQIDGLSAEHIRVGGVEIADPSGFDVIVDRVSQDIDFYRAFLKNAALNGTVVLNDPLVWGSHDRFYHYALARKLGLNVPNTVLIPQKAHPPGTTVQSMRNLEFPLNWDRVFQHVGFPAFLKPLGRGAWLGTQRVESPEHFFQAYDHTDSVCMFLQSAITFTGHYRCFVVGQEHTRLIRYDANKPIHLRHSAHGDEAHPAIAERMSASALKMCRALGYSINAVDFAVRDDEAYLIDSFNLSPEADVHALGQAHFDWFVDRVADLAIQKAQGKASRAHAAAIGAENLGDEFAAGLHASTL